MKKAFSLLLTCSLLITAALLLTACGNTQTNTDTTGGGNQNEEQTILLSDYVLPQNFAITVQIADTAIFNPGNPWYYKTAKIGNDWQIMEYNRTLQDITNQATHFF